MNKKIFKIKCEIFCLKIKIIKHKLVEKFIKFLIWVLRKFTIIKNKTK
jgi:hypothetical protein